MAMAANERSAKWRAENLEHSREQERIRARKAKARGEGRELTEEELHRPKAPLLTEEEKKEKRRIKTAAWRAGNRERSREITRDSMRKTAAERAVSEGREPGKPGRPALFTEEEKRAKRKAKSEKWNAEHPEEVRKYARERGRAVRAGTFVSRALPRLTDEERRLSSIAMSANRRARLKANGGQFNREDVLNLVDEQAGCCLFCNEPLGDGQLHVDHWIPVIAGGSNDVSNLAILHEACNLRKGARLPSEFGLPDDPAPLRAALKNRRDGPDEGA